MSKAVRKAAGGKRAAGGAKPKAARANPRRGRHAAADRRRQLLASRGWHAALEQFARATGLCITLLDEAGRLQAGPFAPTPLAAALSAAQSGAAGRRLHLKLDAERQLPAVLADPPRLAQVFAALVSNAVKFTPDGGTVTLGARRDGDDGVEFFVRDTGAGIRPEAVPHIFDRFRQGDSSTTRKHGGLGIGLSVVRGLVELHGGRVRAESEGEGRGAAFTFRLPAARTPAAAPGAEAGAAEAGWGRAGRGPRQGAARRAPRVLLVDDSPDTLAVVGRMLEASGYGVSTAASAAEALEMVGGGGVDCVITDIGMPETDGFWLLERLREDGAAARLPVVALTGYVSPFDRESILAAGFRAHLAKPIEPRALAAALEEILPDETDRRGR